MSHTHTHKAKKRDKRQRETESSREIPNVAHTHTKRPGEIRDRRASNIYTTAAKRDTNKKETTM